MCQQDGTEMVEDVICIVRQAQTSEWGHFFGGPPLHSGSRYTGSEVPFHLLYSLNPEDPAYPFVVPDSSRLAIYYPFNYNCPELSYHLPNNDELIILREEEESYEYDPDFPYEGYAAEFPKVPVVIERLTPEQIALVMKADELGWEGKGELSNADQESLGELGYPFFTRIGTCHEFLQGEQAGNCSNPTCTGYRGPDPKWDREDLFSFMTIWNNPVSGVSLWGEHGDYSQLICDICPACGMVEIYNRCG